MAKDEWQLKPEHWQSLESLSVSTLSDALDALHIQGALSGFQPMTQGKKVFGHVFTVQYKPRQSMSKSFHKAGDYIDDVFKRAVVVIDNEGHKEASVWGALLTEYATKHDIAGTLVHGCVRDVDTLQQSKYPVFAKGVTPKSGKNRTQLIEVGGSLTMDGVKIEPKDVLVADSNGVVVLPQAQAIKIIELAERIALTEANILDDIQSGVALKEARERHHYEKPWTK